MSWPLGFKVVERRGRILHGLYAPDIVTYRPCGATTPPVGWGPLCVFDYADQAEQFWHYGGGWDHVEIWRVRYEPCAASILGVWDKTGQALLGDLPRGTRLAWRVWLLDRYVRTVSP